MGAVVNSVSSQAMYSLLAIEDWMKTAQANIIGSTRAGFKENEIMFGTNSISITKTPTPWSSPIMNAGKILETVHVRTDWENGDIVDSSFDTHFAINGDQKGFFLLAEPSAVFDQAITANESNLQRNISFWNNNGVKMYLSRDGEFHFAFVPELTATNGAGSFYFDQAVLVNSEGLIVLGDISNAAGPPVVGNSNDTYRPIRFGEFYGTQNKPYVEDPDGLPFPTGDEYNLYDVRPSVITHNRTNDELIYSIYGSTIYNLPNPASTTYSTIVNGSAGVVDRRNINSPIGTASLIGNALESSNVDVEKSMTHILYLGKIHNAITQLFNVANGTIEDVIRLVR